MVAAVLAVHLFVVGVLVFARLTGVGEDLPSYYYAALAAREGIDPYDTASLQLLADGAVGVVHPYLYPPPFLLAVWWLPSLDVWTAYVVWFWLDALWGLALGALLWWRWRDLHPSSALIIGVLLTVLSAIPVNHQLGQANLLIVCLTIAGLWLTGVQQRSGRADAVGGALVGLATAFKLTPALVIAWWLVRRRWGAASAALLTGAAVAMASLAVVPWGHQQSFYLEVLPGLGSGAYNGLTVPIDLFGNHALAQVYDRWFPAEGPALSRVAHLLSSASALVLALAALWVARRPSEDPWIEAARTSIILGAGMMIPAYVFEHHLVWLLPAVTVLLLALAAGKLSRSASAVAVLALALMVPPLAALRKLASPLVDIAPWAVTTLDDSRMVGILLILGCVALLARPRT
jgi:hypothetical protein